MSGDRILPDRPGRRAGSPRSALLVLPLSVLFIALADAMAANRVVRFDRQTFHVMERANSPILAVLASVGRFLSYAVVAWMLLFTLWQLKRRDAAAAVSLIGMTGIFAMAILLIVGRQAGWFYNPTNPATAIDHLFPDVHTLVAVVACGLPAAILASSHAGWYRLRMAVCALSLIGWIALGWLATNVVYATDILGSLLLGAIWCRLCLLVEFSRPVWGQKALAKKKAYEGTYDRNNATGAS